MADPPEREGDGAVGTRALIGAMTAFVVVGMPLVYYLWSVLNELLAGHVDWTRLGLAVPVAALFAALLVFLTRVLSRWEQR